MTAPTATAAGDRRRMIVRRTVALALAACATTPLADLPTPCLALQWEPTAEQSARVVEEAPVAFSAYLVRAETGSDRGIAFAPPQIQAHPERDWSAVRRRLATLVKLVGGGSKAP
ncbi:MAG: hypothetical protein JNL35_19280 [Sphingopyxis sp.]|nr:hypothetical protein [Sphingopyxis sp.]